MNISIGVILKELESRMGFATNIEEDGDFPLRLFQIWEGGEPERDILYVVSGSDIEHNSGRWSYSYIIGAGLNREFLRTSASKWINMEPGTSTFYIVNELQKIFQKFNEWVGRLENLRQESFSIGDILDDFEETWCLSSMVVSKNLKFLFMSNIFPQNNTWIGRGCYMSLDILNELLADEEFRKAPKHKDTFVYDSPIDNVNAYSYCYNIRKNNRYYARLLVQAEKGRISHGVLYLTGCLGKRIEWIMNSQEASDEDIYGAPAFKEMIGDMLKGIHKNSMEIRECMKGLDWEQEHEYQIYIVQFLQKEIPNASHIYYKAQLEEFFGKCYVLEENSNFICLINLTLSSEYKKNNRDTLPVFLRENLCKVGISSEFKDLAQLNEYFMEADTALFIGTNYNSTAWYYHFSDMILPYLKHQMTRGISGEHLIHPAFKRLQEYDRQENTQLVKTVEAYLHNKYNVTHTAQELFIHRTSLLVRLDRIHQLTGVTFDTYEERLHLMLSLLLR